MTTAMCDPSAAPLDAEASHTTARTLALLERWGVQEVVVSAMTFHNLHKFLFPCVLYVDTPGMTSSFVCTLNGRKVTVSTRDAEP